MKKRIVLCICTFILIYIINFFIPRLMPGDPFSVGDAGQATALLTPEQIEEMEAYYGMDKPIGEQFLNTVKNNLSGDFGLSIYYKKPVAQILSERLPWTLLIMGTTLAGSLLFGILLAFISVKKKRIDGALYSIMSALSEIPSFLIGVLLLFLVAANVSWIPLSGNITAFARYTSVWQQIWDIFIHALMPVCAMLVVTTPGFYFVARSSFLSIYQKKYMVNARAKGLSDRRIRWQYLMKNAVLPIAARLFLSVGTCIGATLLIENVFAYPGLGRILRESVKYRDYMLIQGVFLLSTALVLLSSFLSDVLDHLSKRRETI